MEITIPRLINPHSHLREGDAVVRDLVHLAIQGGCSVVGPMPNTAAGLLTAEDVLSYRKDIDRFSDGKMGVIPIVMITPQTTKKMIDECVAAGIRDAKVYPLHRTTKSDKGVRDYGRLLSIICYAGDKGVRCHFHPEHPHPRFENRDAEYQFLPIVDIFMQGSETVIVWEHGTDARCIPFWKQWAEEFSGRFYVTLTAHHLATNESQAFGDVRAVCKPPLKTESDQQGLVDLVYENHNWVMAGLDDAPHDKSDKHVAQGCCACGAYTAPFGLQLYAHALRLSRLQKQGGAMTFNNFISYNAAKLYGHRHRQLGNVVLCEEPWTIPSQYSVGDWEVGSFWAGKEIDWSLK